MPQTRAAQPVNHDTHAPLAVQDGDIHDAMARIADLIVDSGEGLTLESLIKAFWRTYSTPEGNVVSIHEGRNAGQSAVVAEDAFARLTGRMDQIAHNLGFLSDRIHGDEERMLRDVAKAARAYRDDLQSPAPVAMAAVDRLEREILVIDVEAEGFDAPAGAALTYEALLAEGDPTFVYEGPEDEWDAICLNYTSGTTGDPKGVVYHHRGAFMNAVSNALEWDMPKHPVYLWTLPLFHCNGWCFAWTVAARAGVNICLRKIDPAAIFAAIRDHRVTHYCGAPIVHSMLIDAAPEHGQGIDHAVQAMVAGAAPPTSSRSCCPGTSANTPRRCAPRPPLPSKA